MTDFPHRLATFPTLVLEDPHIGDIAGAADEPEVGAQASRADSSR
jgi:hypothetical protein